MATMIADAGTGPRGECHVRFVRIGAGDDQFGGGVPGGGEEQLVLDLGEECLGFHFPDLVVAAEGEQVPDLLIETFFRGADLTNALKQFVEVVPAAGILEPLVVHDKALDDQLTEPGVGPAAELGASGRLDAESDGDDRLEVVVGHVIGFPVGGSCPEIPDN